MSDAHQTPTLLADLTTMHVGGPVANFIETETEADFIEAIRSADEGGTPVLVIGSGSNMLVGDDGFDGIVIKDGRSGFEGTDDDGCAHTTVTAVAGQDWDEFVVAAIDHQWAGIEAMSGIPGTVGAAPVQNIGAYGQEIGAVIASVRVWDRLRQRVRTFAVRELEFGYRNSRLKRSMFASPSASDPKAPWQPTPRYVVLDVTMQLRYGRLSERIQYAELAQKLGIELGQRAPARAVREAVLDLRDGKGMLAADFSGHPAEGDYDRWSAGSFFTNPVLTITQADTLPPDAPRFAVPGAEHDHVKTSAAWLVEHAGFSKGYGVAGADSPATLSTKHTLAITNRGRATAADIAELARSVQGGVEAKFGIKLEPEPVMVGINI